MANIHTLQNIKGHRLGSIREEELEKKIHDAIKSKAEINNLNSLRNNTEIQKLRTHALQVINERKQLQNENTNLISHNAQKDISLAESKAENITKSKKIRSLESMIKILEGRLSLAQKDVISIQNDSSKKESEILTLKSKIAELKNIKKKIDGEITELPKNDTKINPKVSNETSISEISEDNMPIKPNVSEAMPQIPIGAMRPSLEALYVVRGIEMHMEYK
ncbi:1969_t:CDS:2 [Entrophospora sp. SA101]|nr:1969_t:CDS:2 [Entrophospora sp. SA101]